MKIGVLGLGLIGGSMARAISQNTEHTVLGLDINEDTDRLLALLRDGRLQKLATMQAERSHNG